MKLLELAEEVFGNPEKVPDYDTLQSLSAGTIALIRNLEKLLNGVCPQTQRKGHD